MKEQSHKEEMSAAIRGDFRRLRERGVLPALVPQEGEEPAELPPAEETPSDQPDGVAPERRSWLSRLAGR
jgi:hypothetical protein